MTVKMTLKLIAILGILLLTAQVSAEETLVLKTQKEKVSYAVGIELGKNVKRQGIEMEMEALLKGVRDGLSGENPLLSDDNLRKSMIVFQNELKRKQNELREKQVKATRMAAEENRKKGDAFLTENKTKDGVLTLPSGLQYKVLEEGEGKIPTEADTVECHYRGTLINGTEFDSSYKRGQPATFKVTAVIPGWREALKLMPVGSKWQLFIPLQLAYGERGSGRNIGPNATLIFEVELLAIKEN